MLVWLGVGSGSAEVEGCLEGWGGGYYSVPCFTDALDEEEIEGGDVRENEFKKLECRECACCCGCGHDAVENDVDWTVEKSECIPDLIVG